MMCCVCGFKSHHGIFFGRPMLNGFEKAFACISCFVNPSLWFGYVKWQQQRTLMFPGGTRQTLLLKWTRKVEPIKET